MERELVGLAVIAMAVMAYVLWPRRSHGSGRVRRPAVEGPPHPYRRAERPPRPPRRAGDRLVHVVDLAVESSWSDELRAARRALLGDTGDADVLPVAVLEVGERTGCRELAIGWAVRAHDRAPDPDLAYAIARQIAALGDHDEAERWLMKAARAGFRDVARARADEALERLRERPGWAAIEGALAGAG